MRYAIFDWTLFKLLDTRFVCEDIAKLLLKPNQKIIEVQDVFSIPSKEQRTKC